MLVLKLVRLAVVPLIFLFLSGCLSVGYSPAVMDATAQFLARHNQAQQQQVLYNQRWNDVFQTGASDVIICDRVKRDLNLPYSTECTRKPVYPSGMQILRVFSPSDRLALSRGGSVDFAYTPASGQLIPVYVSRDVWPGRFGVDIAIINIYPPCPYFAYGRCR